MTHFPILIVVERKLPNTIKLFHLIPAFDKRRLLQTVHILFKVMQIIFVVKSTTDLSRYDPFSKNFEWTGIDTDFEF